MVLKNLQMKHYEHEQGYVRETIMIFTDPDLKEEEYSLMKSKLSDYTGNHGEVINVEILKNEEGYGAIIHVTIICFKSLIRLLEVTDESYFNFIEKHRLAFMKFYKFSAVGWI